MSMEMNFCRRCGAQLTNTVNHVYKCASGHTMYANCAPTTGIYFLTPDNQVILSVRGIEPHKGMLDAFGGFLDGEETFEAGAVRELREELGLEPGDYEPLNYLTSAVGHYPLEGETLSILCAHFWTRLTTSRKLLPADDVAGTRTIPLHEVDMADLHDDDIRAGIRALQQLFPSTS